MMGAVAALAGEPPSRRPRCTSPVLTDWFLAWADALGDDAGRQLAPYVEPLARSRGSAGDEAARQWLVAGWLLGAALPACLDAAGAGDVARDLSSSSAVRSARELAAVASLVEEAARAARQAHDGWRQAAAALSGGGGLRPAVNRPPWRATASVLGEPSTAAWRAVGDGVRLAVAPVGGLIVPAEAALGIGSHGGAQVPIAIRATPAVVADCLLAVGWSGCYRHLAAGGRSWDLPPREAHHEAAVAATRALGPLHVVLGQQAHEVAGRMLRVVTSVHGATSRRVPGARAS